MNQKVPTILVVEDDADIQVMLEEAFFEAGFYPAIVPTAEEALTLLQGAKDKYQALVSDIWSARQHERLGICSARQRNQS